MPEKAVFYGIFPAFLIMVDTYKYVYYFLLFPAQKVVNEVVKLALRLDRQPFHFCLCGIECGVCVIVQRPVTATTAYCP